MKLRQLWNDCGGKDMQKKMVTSTSAKVSLTVTSYENDEIEGILYNEYFQKRVEIHSTAELIRTMECLYDTLAFPKNFMKPRNFLKFERKKEMFYPEKPSCEKTMIEHKISNTPFQMSGGADSEYLLNEPIQEIRSLADFIIHVKFRMNMEWQGEFFWKQKQQKKNFRSILELIKLMDFALCQGR